MSAVQVVSTVALSAAALAGAANIVGGSLYDFHQSRSAKQRTKAKTGRRRPLVSIVILADNSQDTIETCLTSAVKSFYRKYQIVVVDNASKDDTKMIVNSFIRSNPKKPVRLVAKRQQMVGWRALTSVFKPYLKGDLIITLNAGSLLHRTALGRAVSRFETNEMISMLSFNERTLPNYSIASLVSQFEDSVTAQWKKTVSVAKVKYINRGESFMYRRDIFSQMAKHKNLADETIARRLTTTNLKNRGLHCYYGTDSLIEILQVPSIVYHFRDSYRRKLAAIINVFRYHSLFADQQDAPKLLMKLGLSVAVLKQLALLLVPVVLTYFIYLAASFRTPTLFAFSFAVLSIFLFLTLWGDDYHKISQKAKLSLQLPVLYALFYIMSFRQAALALEIVLLGIKKTVFKLNPAGLPAPRRLLKTPKHNIKKLSSGRATH